MILLLSAEKDEKQGKFIPSQAPLLSDFIASDSLRLAISSILARHLPPSQLCHIPDSQ